ncbi:MAG: dihydroneopterin aldolase [Bacteroidales bacterium]
MRINQPGRNLVELVNMEFYAHHGHFKEERIIGNKFLVSFSAETDLKTPSISDDLNDALNYQELYNLISEEMAIPSKLLENVAGRILARVKKSYPNVKWAQVSISKLNPPVGGKVEASRIVMSY